MPIGALASAVEFIKRDWLESEIRHLIMALGGGALLAAVALVLVPEGAKGLSITGVAFWFTLGGISFMTLDILLDRIHTTMAQLAAMLSDFIPEAMALGAALASGSDIVLLLAGLMALQNIPEGFNSSRELKDSTGMKNAHIIAVYVLLALLGPICGLLGYYVLADKTTIVSAIMMFSAGGILYITFGDIAPQAKLENHWFPAVGAIAGFLLGLIGHLLTH